MKYLFSTLKSWNNWKPIIKDTPFHNKENFKWKIEYSKDGTLISYVLEIFGSLENNIYIDTYSI